MATFYEEELVFLLTGLLSGIPSMLFGIASYVLSSLAVYTIAQRRGLNKPWLAWVPVVNVWLLGSLSDQYQYVVRRENKARRKWLLGLSLFVHLTAAVVAVLSIGMAVHAVMGGMYGMREREMFSRVMGSALSILGMVLPLAGAAIAYAVIRFMALYDVYRSLDPNNAVLYLVLSVLFSPTEPFFLFFNRDKDKGMPPRRAEPAYEAPPQEPVQEPWEQENKDYL